MNVGIILAAGSGTRINKTHNISHKCMLKIDNVTFLENTLIQLDEVCDIIYIVVGHKAPQLEDEIFNIYKNVRAKIIVIENTIYKSTNNISSMNMVFNHAYENNIEFTNMFYVESDVWISPHINIFKSFVEDAPDDNVRAVLWTPKGQPEWRIKWCEDNKTAIDYIDDDLEGFSVIGAAKFTKEFVDDLSLKIVDVLRVNDQIYWDEAERLLLKTHDVYPYILSDSEIIEVDNDNDFKQALKLGYNIST